MLGKIKTSSLLTAFSYLIVLLALSRIAWYDYKGILVVSGKEQGEIRLFFYIFSLLLLPTTIFWLRQLKHYKVDWLSLFTIVIALMGVFLALIYQNSLNYTLGDTYKFILFISAIYIGRNFKGTADNEKILFFAVYAGLSFALIRYYSFYTGFFTSFGFAYGVAQDIFMYFAGFILLVRKVNVFRVLCFVAIVSMIAFGQKRSLGVILIVLTPFVLLWMKNSWKKVFALISLSVFTIISILFISTADLDSFTNFSRIISTDWSDKLRLQDGRSDEVEALLIAINEKGRYFLGAGSGAEFLSNGKIIHSVHVTPLGLYFRYGIIGGIYFLFLFFIVVSNYTRNFYFKKHNNDSFYILSNLYLLGALGMSLGIFGFVDDPLVGLCLGYMLKKNKETANYVNRIY